MTRARKVGFALTGLVGALFLTRAGCMCASRMKPPGDGVVSLPPGPAKRDGALLRYGESWLRKRGTVWELGLAGPPTARGGAVSTLLRKQMVDDAIELEQMQKDREQKRLEEERRHPDELSQEERLARVRGIGTTNVDSFKLAGFGTVEEIVKEADLTRIGNVAGIGIKKARQIKAAAEHYLNEENKRRAELDALKKAGGAAPAL